MTKEIHIIEKETDLIELASKIKQNIQFPTLLLLEGNLGSGKTTFCKYFFTALGLKASQVKSPTYSLINNFQVNSLHINHIDLYRLEQTDQILLEEIGQLTSYPKSITAIEWPERMNLQSILGPNLKVQKIKIAILENNSREITIENLS